MKTRIILPAVVAAFGLLYLFTSCGQAPPDHFTIAFYNVENLFDTINDNGERDGDFTPGAAVSWNTERYDRKLNNIARVLGAIDSTELPLVIGLAEVENLGVLRDLVATQPLDKGGYDIVHFDSPDERGIDVALLYRHDMLQPLHSRPYPLTFYFDSTDRTRDLLYFKALAADRDTLHLLVNHWPSRSGGKELSDPKRQRAAQQVRQVVDSIFRFDANANIIIMGDLNDNPTDDNVAVTLGARVPENNVRKQQLYNLATEKFTGGEGTLYWRSWDLFDQFIVSSNVLDGITAYKLSPASIQILKKDWMLFRQKDGNMVPNRTAGRNEYYGGYSDHLPVYIRFEKK
ncbi:MAG: endonuclease/exonuclease/phosphatase family protein [Clostridia bacterium]|nr:endonuclease/exonuclease/phosphatase family protein [Clostridia bacterium]